MKKLLLWLDENILTVFSFFLIIFIPLYPKIPLFEAIPGYIVRVRLEDVFILIAFLVFLIQVIRKKAQFKSIIFWPMVAYLFFGLISIPSAVFISKTIPLDKLHIYKAGLHWLRRIEYFSLLFIFYNGIRTLRKGKKLFLLVLLALILVSIYGFGQKYLYWPLYSTMNREFSKGMKLYLTEHARVPSTFGGHYDLAAFLVLFLTLLMSFFVILKGKVLRWLYLLAFILSYWLLILTASRTSFIAYIAAITVLFFIFIFKKGFLWSLPRWLSIILFSFSVMLMFGDLSDRFAHFFKMPQIKEKLKLNTLLQPLRPAPKEALKISDEIALVMDKTDERPVLEKPEDLGGNQSGRATSSAGLPPDVYEDIPDYYLEATGSATMAAVLIPVQRTFSENAYKYGLSTAIRLDALWPRAIAGFKKNPLLGSGYSTLSKNAVEQFTEAESTDNDYLRTLGETGILGFLSFFSIIFLLIKTSFELLKRKKLDPYVLAFSAAFLSFTVGLLINALYIDVFEASKVAFMFWALSGVLLAFASEIKNPAIKR